MGRKSAGSRPKLFLVEEIEWSASVVDDYFLVDPNSPYCDLYTQDGSSVIGDEEEYAWVFHFWCSYPRTLMGEAVYRKVSYQIDNTPLNEALALAFLRHLTIHDPDIVVPVDQLVFEISRTCILPVDFPTTSCVRFLKDGSRRLPFGGYRDTRLYQKVADDSPPEALPCLRDLYFNLSARLLLRFGWLRRIRMLWPFKPSL